MIPNKTNLFLFTVLLLVWSCGSFVVQEPPSTNVNGRCQRHKRKSHDGYRLRLGKIPVEQVDIDTGEVICTFPSMQEAANQLNFSVKSISRVVRREAGRISYKGYFWRKVGDREAPRKQNRFSVPHGKQRVQQICPETGIVLGTFDSISEASISLNISSKLIRNTLMGLQKKTGGFSFKKVGEPVPFKKKTKGRPVQQLCLETGKVLATFPSQRLAGMAVNVTNSSIRQAALGVTSKSSGGYAWRYLEEEEEKEEQQADNAQQL